MGNSNVDVIRKGYAAFDSGDLDTIQGLFAEDAVWHIGGRNLLTADYKGRDEIFGFLAKLITLTDGTFKTAVHSIAGDESEHVIVLSSVTARREGRVLESGDVTVYHVRGERVVEAWSYPTDQYAEDSFWS